MRVTLELLSALKQIQVTLQHDTHTAASPSTPAPTVSCALDDKSFPFKPLLKIRYAHHNYNDEAVPGGTSAAASSSPPSVDYIIPLCVHANLADTGCSVTHSADGAATLLTIKYTADLSEAEGEDDFPAARELAAPEYAAMYCRQCGEAVLTSAQAAAAAVTAASTAASASAAAAVRASSSAPATVPAFQVLPLPSPYWSELTDLWFCVSGPSNAHLSALANMQIVTQRGRILMERMNVRVHVNDLCERVQLAWKQEGSVRKLLQRVHEQSHAAQLPQPDATMEDATHSATAASCSSSRDVWSPLPCPRCLTPLGTILLTVNSASTSAASSTAATAAATTVNGEIVRVADAMEARLFKHRLSNCFRKKDNSTAADASSVSSAAAALDSPCRTPSDSCLCASLSPSPILHCANVFIHYSLENRIAEELYQKYTGSTPVARFLLCVGEDEEDAEHANTLASACIRLFVTHWALPLACSSVAAFPYTPRLLADPSSNVPPSNALVPCVKLEYAVHRMEAKAATDATTEAAAAQLHVWCKQHEKRMEKLYYTRDEIHALTSILNARSQVWPVSTRVSSIDASMQKSCLARLSKRISPCN